MTPQESPSPGGELIRATIFHTPRNPFVYDTALESFADGGLLIKGGKVLACGDFADLREAFPQSSVTDLRGGFLLPGLIDTHTHFPQTRVIGNLGRSLLDWLDQCALPEEAKMSDQAHAVKSADHFVHALASHGTTTALVFGSHFAPATAALFEAAAARGLRVVSGLVLSDRLLLPELHCTPDCAYNESSALIRRYHGHGRLRYAVTPRFALSASEAMLEVCQSLMREHDGLHFQTHLNENRMEIEEVARLFPWAQDYLAVYERFSLCKDRSVLAHNVHPTPSELHRLAASGATIAHCPASNAALGSGVFPLNRHIEAGVRCALGTDVGAGTGFGLLKEGLQAYLMQRVAPEAVHLSACHLLYLATRAGAEALGMGDEIGDFTPGRKADFVYLRAPAGSPLAAIVEEAGQPERILAALFTLADRESVQEVRVDGAVVFKRDAG